MGGKRLVRPAVFGVGAAALLLAVYIAVVAAVSGWAFMLSQFIAYWYFIVALAIGFGMQVALYLRLRDVARHRDASVGVVAASGGTSTAAMVSCCAHYVANVAPVLGASGFVALVAQYQTELFWVGLVLNAAAIVYVGRKLWLASAHMARMARQA